MKSYIFGFVVLIGSFWLLLNYSSSAPGESAVGRGAPATSDEQEAAERLAGLCEALALEIGPRGAHAPASQEQIDRLLQRELRRLHLEPAEISLDCAGTPGKAMEVMIPGRALGRETVLLTAHVDSAPGSPGADDNASGVAMLLEVLRTLCGGNGVDRTVRVVFWNNGAAPLAGTEKSAAAAYAKRLKARHEKVAVALCFDSLGVYSDVPGGQQIPFPFEFNFPDKGDFVAFVGDWGTRGVMDHAVQQFRMFCKLPSQAMSLPSSYDFISLSDDGALRDEGFPALRVTDTAQLRSALNGTPGDVTAHLDYDRMARVAKGLAETVVGLGKRSTPLL